MHACVAAHLVALLGDEAVEAAGLAHELEERPSKPVIMGSPLMVACAAVGSPP